MQNHVSKVIVITESMQNHVSKVIVITTDFMEPAYNFSMSEFEC